MYVVVTEHNSISHAIGPSNKIVELSNIVIQIKMSIKNLIDNPDKLLEFIDICLKPKQIEKKQYGEVFTPMKLVNEMLDKLDEYYILYHGHSIFTEKKLKWFNEWIRE
jgi:hypothetical protein